MATCDHPSDLVQRIPYASLHRPGLRIDFRVAALLEEEQREHPVPSSQQGIEECSLFREIEAGAKLKRNPMAGAGALVLQCLFLAAVVVVPLLRTYPFIRIWHAGLFEGQDVWLGAATHDAGVGFQLRSRTITHRIDPQTDAEREKVVTDLDFAACSERVSYLEPSRSASFPQKTDGRLAVVWLRPCDGGAPDDNPALQAPGSRTKRMARRFVLETRQYFLRDNMYYWAYRAVISARNKRIPAETSAGE